MLSLRFEDVSTQKSRTTENSGILKESFEKIHSPIFEIVKQTMNRENCLTTNTNPALKTFVVLNRLLKED